MVKATDPLKEFTAVHPDDLALPTDQQTIWHYSGLGLRASELIQNLQTALVEGPGDSPDKLTYQSGSIEVTALKYGMKRPTNFSTVWAEEPSGPQFQGMFSPTDAYLDTIPRSVRSWLAQLIAKASTVSEDEAGKSSPQSTSSSTKGSSPTADTAAVPSS